MLVLVLVVRIVRGPRVRVCVMARARSYISKHGSTRVHQCAGDDGSRPNAA
jgi:hypothetical protein